MLPLYRLVSRWSMRATTHFTGSYYRLRKWTAPQCLFWLYVPTFRHRNFAFWWWCAHIDISRQLKLTPLISAFGIWLEWSSLSVSIILLRCDSFHVLPPKFFHSLAVKWTFPSLLLHFSQHTQKVGHEKAKVGTSLPHSPPAYFVN